MHVTGTAKNDISNRIARTTASRWSVRANTFQKFVRQNSWVAPGAVYLFIAWTFANLYYFILPKNLVESVEVLSAFKAQKPMQLRVLVPAIIHFISSYVPLTVSTLDKYILIVGVWAMLIAFALFLRGYVSKSVSYITAPIILVPLTWNCCLLTPFHYPSDIPAIAFFLGCLVLWRAKKITWYYVCFAIACFNRETILFAFPCVMALYWQDSKAREWVKNGVIHLAIYAAIRVILLKIFENSPGIPVVNQFQRNLKLLMALCIISWFSLGVCTYSRSCFYFGHLGACNGSRQSPLFFGVSCATPESSSKREFLASSFQFIPQSSLS
jgi:hypothetical protein